MWALAVLLALLLGLPIVMHNQYFLHVMIVIGINVIMAVSMWLLGITGLISFGQAGFMFIGCPRPPRGWSARPSGGSVFG